jgi:hypothetical protein
VLLGVSIDVSTILAVLQSWFQLGGLVVGQGDRNRDAVLVGEGNGVLKCTFDVVVYL